MITEDPDPEPGGSARVKVAIQTVGCKLNQAESESLANSFINAGFRVVSPADYPDVYILNTCTVTHIADRKCRQYLRSFHRRNPGTMVVALGCYPERDGWAAGADGVDLAIGNRDKAGLVETIRSRLLSDVNTSRRNGNGALGGLGRTRSMIKVQEGCTHGCAYCVVPLVRGKERSIAESQVLADIRAREAAGCREVVITGTRIGAYSEEGGLGGLVRLILRETSVPRIRLSSLQPGELTPELLELWDRDTRLCRHLHLALQSGCEATLRRMRRAYNPGEYAAAVRKAREAIPGVAITTDIMVGFPGEDQSEFDQSYDFCRETGFADMHVFPFSPRSDTPAARMSGTVGDRIKRDRSRAMMDLAFEGALAFRTSFQGKKMPVLWEERKRDGLWIGHTDNYLKVFTRYRDELEFRGNCLLETMIGGEYRDGVWGEVSKAGSMTGPGAEGVCGYD